MRLTGNRCTRRKEEEEARIGEARLDLVRADRKVVNESHLLVMDSELYHME